MSSGVHPFLSMSILHCASFFSVSSVRFFGRLTAAIDM